MGAGNIIIWTFQKCQMKIWSSHLLDNLSNCLMNLKNSGDSTGFEPMTSAMPVQCSHQLSYEVTVESRSICWAHVFPWKECHMKECYMQCGVWIQMKIWSSHLLDNLSNCLMNLKNSGDSTGFEPMTSAMPVQYQVSYQANWELCGSIDDGSTAKIINTKIYIVSIHSSNAISLIWSHKNFILLAKSSWGHFVNEIPTLLGTISDYSI